MGAGTFEAKFAPLSKTESINKIYVLRKNKAKEIENLEYIILPKICNLRLFYVLITPLLLAHYAKKYNAKYILAYHIIPHAFFAFIASKITGIPYIVGQTGLYVQKLSNKFIYGNLICSILKKAKWLNVPGSFSKNHWINKGLLPQKINLLHSTINTDIFVNTHNNKEYDFIYLGRLAWEKNIEIIIDAFKTISSEIHNPKLVIVGNGPEKKKLEEYVKINSLENRVVFAGFQKDVTHWLNKARFFVMASVTEAMPTALMQAMSCELICISSNVGNITDLLEHNKNGFLFESGNQSELSDIMSYCISNTESISKIGTQAREDVILNHSYHTAIKKWDELFKNA